MKIIIRIDKLTGEVVVEAEGYYRSDCIADLDYLISVIGGETYEVKDKDELYYTENILQQRRK